jgi:protein SCO1
MTRKKIALPSVLLVISLAVLGLMAGALAWRVLDRGAAPAAERLIVLPQPRAIADFALQDHHGQPFSLDDFRGRWSVLFFGFTSCPDICPDTLYQLQQARSRLADRLPPEQVPAIYLVSVDPERDTPARLADYLAFFDREFTGLTGEDPQLRALTMQLGVMYHIAPHEEGDTGYLVDHSASLLVLDREAQLYGVLRAPHEADAIVSDLTGLLRREGAG